jgi:hypothetical protein
MHLPAAMDHATGGILAQTEVDATTNEITRFRPLLERLDLAGQVVTADADPSSPPRANRATAQSLRRHPSPALLGLTGP